jgi:WD40 repeat protein
MLSTFPHVSKNISHIYLSGLPFENMSSKLLSHHQSRYPHLLHPKPSLSSIPTTRQQPVVLAAVAGDFMAAIISDSQSASLKVFKVHQSIEEIFHWSLDLPLDYLITNFPSPTLPVRQPGYALAISSRAVAVGRKDCKIWSLQDGEKAAILHPCKKQSECYITSLAFAPRSSTRIAVGCENGRIMLYDLGIAPEPSHTELQGERILYLTYSDDGSQVICGTSKPSIHIFDATGRLLSTFKADFPSSNSPEWSLDQPYPVEDLTFRSSSDKVIYHSHWCWRICDIVTGQNKLSEVGVGFTSTFALPGHPQISMNRQYAIALSSNGRVAAIGDSGNGIVVLDTVDDKVIIVLVGHTDYVSSLTFLDDSGCRLLSSSFDGTIRTWDLESLIFKGEKKYAMDKWQSGRSIASSNSFPTTDRAGAWILDEEGEMLFWCPSTRPFRHSRNTLVCGTCYDLDLTHFVRGEEWTRCREPIGAEEKTLDSHAGVVTMLRES